MTVIEAANYIDGKWHGVNGGASFESTASHDGELISRAPVADEAAVDAAVQAARRAFRESGWPETRASARGNVLFEVADRLEREARPIAELVAREMGKPIRLSLDREVLGAVDKLRYFAGAGRAIYGDVTGAAPASVLDFTWPQPIGVCALIVPWNDPVDLAVRKLGAALAAGCTAVVKSSEETPASTEALMRLFEDVPGLPEGVVNLLHGPGTPTGEALVTHPEIDKVSFTGSTATGRRIMELASGNLKRVSLECGGKAPVLVFSDCDIDKAIDAIAYGAFIYAGQSCTAATRLLIERSLYDQFLERLVKRVESLPVGDPLDERTLIGPVVSQRQLDRVRSFLDSVEADGGAFATGGTIEGLYVAPTIVTGLAPDARLAKEEVFGPVLAAFAVDSEEEALAVANDVRYGLAASVWTSDISRALRVVRKLDFGDIWVNTHYVRNTETPFGGWKESGMGKELGIAGVKEYLAHKRVAIDTARDFHLKTWFENP